MKNEIFVDIFEKLSVIAIYYEIYVGIIQFERVCY